MKFKLNTFDTVLSVSKIANVHYFEFTEFYETTDDSHEFCELLYIDRGSLIVHSEDFNGLLSDGQLIIHDAFEVHSLKCSAGSAPNVIIIGFECTCEELKRFSQTPISLSTEHKKMLSEIMKEGMNVYAPPYDMPNTLEMKKRDDYAYGADQMLKLRLEMFLITLIREYLILKKTGVKRSYSSLSKPEEIYKYISEHYTEKILLDDLCFLFGTNKTTLCRDFKNEFGTTVLNFVNSLKIREAKGMLRKNEISVTEISESLGFNSIHYFCKVFKKHTGLSPKEYIKLVRSKLEI